MPRTQSKPRRWRKSGLQLTLEPLEVRAITDQAADADQSASAWIRGKLADYLPEINSLLLCKLYKPDNVILRCVAIKTPATLAEVLAVRPTGLTEPGIVYDVLPTTATCSTRNPSPDVWDDGSKETSAIADDVRRITDPALADWWRAVRALSDR